MAGGKIPSSEIIWMRILSKNKKQYVITSKDVRDCYYIYELQEDNTYKKLGKAKSPPELEAKFMK